jgi:hypothetical protein
MIGGICLGCCTNPCKCIPACDPSDFDFFDFDAPETWGPVISIVGVANPTGCCGSASGSGTNECTNFNMDIPLSFVSHLQGTVCNQGGQLVKEHIYTYMNPTIQNFYQVGTLCSTISAPVPLIIHGGNFGFGGAFPSPYAAMHFRECVGTTPAGFYPRYWESRVAITLGAAFFNFTGFWKSTGCEDNRSQVFTSGLLNQNCQCDVTGASISLAV